MHPLANKTLVMIVGPTAIGKSTVMHEIIALDDEFSYASSFTTRPKRTGEDTTYRHVTTDEAMGINERGAAYTYIKHPTTGIIYGTDDLSFTTAYTLLDTLSSTVSMYQSLPFKQTVSISLTADPADWQQWLDKRFPKPSQDRTKRLLEARQSIQWSLAQTHDHSWIVNRPNHTSETAREIINVARGVGKHDSTVPKEAVGMLELVERLLSYEQKKESSNG